MVNSSKSEPARGCDLDSTCPIIGRHDRFPGLIVGRIFVWIGLTDIW